MIVYLKPFQKRSMYELPTFDNRMCLNTQSTTDYQSRFKPDTFAKCVSHSKFSHDILPLHFGP